MAIFMPGISECPICQRVLTDDDERFGTWGTFPVPRGLFRFCDATMHWLCYAAWPRRREFARAYFDFWVANRFWAKVYLDDQVLVTANPFAADGGELELVLADTGSRLRVSMNEWEQWLDVSETSEGRRLHPLEIKALRQVTPALKAALPTADAVMDALSGEEWPSKGDQ